MSTNTVCEITNIPKLEIIKHFKQTQNMSEAEYMMKNTIPFEQYKDVSAKETMLALFMGWYFVNDSEVEVSVPVQFMLPGRRSWDLDFFNFDWLMAVFERIADVNLRFKDKMFNYEITSGYVKITGTSRKILYNCSIEGSVKKAMFKAACHFVEWYIKTIISIKCKK